MRSHLIKLFFLSLLLISLISCKKADPVDPWKDHICTEFEKVIASEGKCNEKVVEETKCTQCGKVKESNVVTKQHELVDKEIPGTCLERGEITTSCLNCDYSYTIKTASLGHDFSKAVIDDEATKLKTGRKHLECSRCGIELTNYEYAYNGVSRYKKLRVEGTNIISEEGEVVRLYGLSTHGLQWFARYVNILSFAQIQKEFGINVIRLSMTTAEGGYCEVDDSKKQYFYDLIKKGVDICKALDMYVIIDWHMVGAVDENDRNPLYYKEEAIDFFSRLSYDLRDYNNVLYEIMNEPCGQTTWNDCYAYANLVIPKIRENTDSIVLVGNPHWSADLGSVLNKPLTGYENIMYTYHFYAGSGQNTLPVKNAVEKGLPVFISEHGGMNSDGDGPINYSNIKTWYKALDDLGLSIVAWNISNSKGSASILKQETQALDDFSDKALKEWGVYYKTVTRKLAGLSSN